MAVKSAKKKQTSNAQSTEDAHYDLHLYISGATERSRSALANIKAIGEKYLQGRYRLAVVDLYQQPELAQEQQIVAVPMLVKMLPLPLRRMIGDLSSEERVLIGLDLVPQSIGNGNAP